MEDDFIPFDYRLDVSTIDKYLNNKRFILFTLNFNKPNDEHSIINGQLKFMYDRNVYNECALFESDAIIHGAYTPYKDVTQLIRLTTRQLIHSIMWFNNASEDYDDEIPIHYLMDYLDENNLL